MNLNKLLCQAIDLATEKHYKQYDRNGQPYLGHVMRVMNSGQTMEEKIVGALHDLVEDTDVTINQLIEMGFPATVTDAVSLLTHQPGDDYMDYIHKTAKNPLSRRVKLYDLTDNMDIRRMSDLDEQTITRLKKYFKAYRFLIAGESI